MLKKIFGWSTWLMFLVFYKGGAAAESVGTVSQEGPFVSVVTPGFGVRIAPMWAWTLDAITYRGRVLSDDKGLHGLVFDLGEGKFVGSGHREGGREEVLEVKIEADGKPVDIFLAGEIKGDEILIVKNSRVAGLSLQSILKIKAEEIESEQFIRIEQDFRVARMYAFMYPWLTSTSEYIAETIGGKALEGEFASKGFIVHDKLRWSAVYEPQSQTAAISYFPLNKAEDNFLHFFNDHEAYRKQYFSVMGERELKAGEEFRFGMKMRAIVAPQSEWKQKAREVAGAMVRENAR